MIKNFCDDSNGEVRLVILGYDYIPEIRFLAE